MKRIVAQTVLCLIVTLSITAVFAQQVVVTPEETDEILANPGIGWETFHRTSKQDKSLPSWIPSTIQYARWGWGELEREPGKLNTDFLDKVLKDTHDSGQKLAFRVMCCSTTKGSPYHPAWLKNLGGKELIAEYGTSSFPIPDMDDPIVLKAHLDFIKRLGEKYDGHPDIDHVDLGSIGWWGEWHLTGSNKNRMPTLENRIKVIDAYLAAFKKTPLVMLIGGQECLKYACNHGTGWRADCLGDMGGFSKNWCHMRKGYPIWIKEAGVADVWKTAPVAWETCWDMRKWVNEGWSLRFIFNYALACHASVINNKSAPLPQNDNVRPEIERFLRRLGYRLILKEIKHPAQVNGTFEVAMKWQNVGSAPCYRPYRLAYRLTNENGFSKVIVGNTTVNRWLPGSIELFTEEFFKEPKDLPPGPIYDVSDKITLPADLPAGNYTFSVAIVDDSSAPVVRLGINGRDKDGWYPLSKIQVAKFDVTTEKKEDQVKVVVADQKATFDIHSSSGIGGATILPKTEKWPKIVIVRFHLGGLERFSISNGKVTLSGSVLSHSGHAQLLYLNQGDEEKKVEKDSPYWTEIKMIGPDGKPTTTIPLKNGYFEIVLPNALFQDNPRILTLSWINFYRG